jgi:hypothetical protein
MPNSRFKIQDLSLQRSLPEKQQITVLYCRARFTARQRFHRDAA